MRHFRPATSFSGKTEFGSVEIFRQLTRKRALLPQNSFASEPERIDDPLLKKAESVQLVSL